MKDNDIMIGGVEMSDLGFLVSEVKITQPEPKRNLVDVPGTDNYLDFTESFGAIYYYPREDCKIAMDFIGDYDEWEEALSRLARIIQGKRVKLVLGWEPFFYYEGRFMIVPAKTNDTIGEIRLRVSLDAYKRSCRETVVQISVSGDKTFVLKNLFERVVPQITATGDITLTGNGETVELTPGTTAKYQEFILTEGDNEFTAVGSGTLLFSYREGSL